MVFRQPVLGSVRLFAEALAQVLAALMVLINLSVLNDVGFALSFMGTLEWGDVHRVVSCRVSPSVVP
jgi:hypothetical protein